MSPAPVTFVLHGEARLDDLAGLDPDRDWREFVTGERAWILQTCLRLRAAGCDVGLASELPADGIAVFSSKQRRALTRRGKASSALLIGVRGDLGEALIADLEVLQNAQHADGRRRFFIPHWPQPAMIARDPARGSRIENVAFKGFLGNLHPSFREAPWQQFLSDRGIRWLADAAPYKRDGVDAAALEWNDFREIDLIVAVRAPDPQLHPRKPATKLFNAWLAGVPALLGPEVAYREQRRSPLDYIEVADPGQARAALTRLRADPNLYAEMVEHGSLRARDFATAATVARWREFLFATAPSLRERADIGRWRGRSLRAKEWSRRVQRAVGMWK